MDTGRSEYRYSSAAKPAYMVVNSDTRCRRLNERSARDNSAGTLTRGAAPRKLTTGGRGCDQTEVTG